MLMQNNYDYIIIGAGCAGLSLAYRLLNKSHTVCIIESSDDINKRNKLWSFWDTYETPFNHLIKKKWKNLLISNENESIKINCEDYNYQSISSLDFNNFILDKINTSSNIDILFSLEVKQIVKKNSDVVVITDKDEYFCSHVFDSRPNNKKTFMKQQFFGAYIKSKEDIFDDNLAAFMEFTTIKNKFHFNYILPFSKNMALIESTFFSCNEEKNLLNKEYINEYMREKYGDKEYVIEKTEFGSIPMDIGINSLSEQFITKIGSFSGATRASTGYTFINIQRQMDYLMKIIPNIQKNKINKHFHKFILRKMDSIFLRIISRNPDYMKIALMDLFRTSSHKAQIRFLSDMPSIFDIMKIIFYLPKLKFLLYALGIREKNDK